MQTDSKHSFPLFALGFRPFFLGGGAAAVVLMTIWVLTLSGHLDSNPYLVATLWHSHEMIFGFVAAVIVGFLLTAVQAWTGIPGIKGKGLALLFCLWLLGRILLAFPPEHFHILVALVDLSLFPITAMVLASFVIKAKQWRNGIFIPILLLFFIANLLVHLQALGITMTASVGLSLGLWLVVLLIIILGGRVLPMFTSNGLGGVEVHSWKFINMGSIFSYIALACSDLFQLVELLPWLALLCAVFHAIRLYGWRPFLTFRTPLLWILHSGYAWLIAGFILLALTPVLELPRSVAIHAFAVGVIGNFIIGMMSRVALGHTGRPLVPARVMSVAYVLVNVSALLRVILPLFVDLPWLAVIMSAGITWILAYAVFVVVYTPILCLPRIDGKEG